MISMKSIARVNKKTEGFIGTAVRVEVVHFIEISLYWRKVIKKKKKNKTKKSRKKNVEKNKIVKKLGEKVQRKKTSVTKYGISNAFCAFCDNIPHIQNM